MKGIGDSVYYERAFNSYNKNSKLNNRTKVKNTTCPSIVCVRNEERPKF